MINGYKLIDSPVRSIRARVERYEGSALVDTFASEDRIKEVTLERVGDTSKFFGFGICQKGNIKLIDKDRELSITTANHFNMAFTGVEQAVEQISNGTAGGLSVFESTDVGRSFLVNGSKYNGLTPGVKYSVTIDIKPGSGVKYLALRCGKQDIAVFPVVASSSTRQTITGEFVMPEYLAGYSPVEGYGYIEIQKRGSSGSAYSADSTFYLLSIMQTGEAFVNVSPEMHVSEVHRDENTNQLSITVYDRLYKAANHTLEELEMVAPYTIDNVVTEIASILGITEVVYPEDTSNFGLNYEHGANYEGTETLREILDDIAEVTMTVYYINKDNQLVFKQIATAAEPVLTISKEDYVKLESGTNRRLTRICNATELGDNVAYDTGHSGTTQYIRDNGFWELRNDIGDLVQAAINLVGDLTINQFTCSWRGNPLLEIGDKIEIVTKDDEKVQSYVFDDTISYNGAFSQATQWKYTGSDTETDSNPATLGDALRRTYAKVDKVSRNIELVASDVSSQQEQISSLNVNINNITASVQKVETSVDSKLENVNSSISTLASQVEAKMSPEDVTIQIQKEISNGTNKVLTSTGFTFDEEGLTVSKSGSAISTQITEDGMSVSRNGHEVLAANNEGVTAEDLHAITYLIIGQNSRFEDFDGGNRTGCFWIG
jgi:hypothetical protein